METSGSMLSKILGLLVLLIRSASSSPFRAKVPCSCLKMVQGSLSLAQLSHPSPGHQTKNMSQATTKRRLGSAGPPAKRGTGLHCPRKNYQTVPPCPDRNPETRPEPGSRRMRATGAEQKRLIREDLIIWEHSAAI